MVEATLGDRLTVAIDPNWPHRSLWQHPLGSILRVAFVGFEDGISESVTPAYVDTEVVGRAEAYKTWINNPNRSIPVTFVFRAQGIDGTTPEDVIQREVIQPARFLDALKYPVLNPQQGIVYAPPPVILRIGNLLTVRCVLTGGDIEWNFEAMDPDLLLPHGAKFSATFEVTRSSTRDLGYFPNGSSGGPISGVWV